MHFVEPRYLLNQSVFYLTKVSPSPCKMQKAETGIRPKTYMLSWYLKNKTSTYMYMQNNNYQTNKQKHLLWIFERVKPKNY